MLAELLSVDHAAILMLLENEDGALLPVPFLCQQQMGEGEADCESVPVFKKNDAPFLEISCKMGNEPGYRPIHTLSGSEQNRLILDLLIAKARVTCKQRLTLLLIDDDLTSNFSKPTFEHLLRTLATEDFQVVVTLPHAHGSYARSIEDGGLPEEMAFLDSWQVVPVQNGLPGMFRRMSALKGP